MGDVRVAGQCSGGELLQMLVVVVVCCFPAASSLLGRGWWEEEIHCCFLLFSAAALCCWSAALAHFASIFSVLLLHTHEYTRIISHAHLCCCCCSQVQFLCSVCCPGTCLLCDPQLASLLLGFAAHPNSLLLSCPTSSIPSCSWWFCVHSRINFNPKTNYHLQLSTTDILAPASMKNAANCET